MSESLCRDRGNEIINREHKDFPSPIAKGNRSLFLLSRNFWNLPNLPLQSLQGSWLSPWWGNKAFKWILPSGLHYGDLQTGQNPREGCWCVLTCSHCSFLITHHDPLPSQRAYHMQKALQSCQCRVPGWPSGWLPTAIKQGHKADDLENVWGALQDLEPRLQNLHPSEQQWWNFHRPDGLWVFRVNDDWTSWKWKANPRERGRLAVWSSHGEVNLLFNHKQ